MNILLSQIDDNTIASHYTAIYGIIITDIVVPFPLPVGHPTSGFYLSLLVSLFFWLEAELSPTQRMGLQTRAWWWEQTPEPAAGTHRTGSPNGGTTHARC